MHGMRGPLWCARMHRVLIALSLSLSLSVTHELPYDARCGALELVQEVVPHDLPNKFSSRGVADVLSASLYGGIDGKTRNARSNTWLNRPRPTPASPSYRPPPRNQRKFNTVPATTGDHHAVRTADAGVPQPRQPQEGPHGRLQSPL